MRLEKALSMRNLENNPSSSAAGERQGVFVSPEIMKDRVAASLASQKRLEVLARYQIMDTPAEPQFDALVVRASAACETPMAMITLLDDRRQWFKARVGTDLRETPIEHALCTRALNYPDEVTVVTDARYDDRFLKNPAVTGPLRIRFYAAAPIITTDGVPIGTLCVIDREPRHLPKAKRDLLQALAREAASLIEAGRGRLCS